jgi:hypothetical protein
MNKIIFAVLILASSLAKFYSQDDITIVQGKKYKFVLFDDTQVIGKVISVDAKFVKVQTSKGVFTVPRENILFISTDLTPEKYDFSLSLTGGVSFLNRGYYYYSRESQPGPHFNAGAMFFISNSKAVKVDLSVSFAKPKFEIPYYSYYEGEPPEPDKFEGGESVYFSLKPNFAIGQFNPSEKITAYGSLGWELITSHRKNGLIPTTL